MITTRWLYLMGALTFGAGQKVDMTTTPTRLIPSGYSERIVIPRPPRPTIINNNDQLPLQTHCPHQLFFSESMTLVDWHDAGLTPQMVGGNVVLPTNTAVVVSQSIPIQLGLVTIPPTSALILGENPAGIQLHLTGMLVQGQLLAGSETCRIQTPITLTFHGKRPIDVVTNVPAPHTKGISVQGGTLSLHGQSFYPTWTRLSRTVEVGETQLVVQDDVNWEEGQEIVLVTTAMKDSREWHQNEVLEIARVRHDRAVGTVVQVTKPVQYRHVANHNYQAEVGLLSRVIKIHGAADDSEPTDPDPLNCTIARSNYGDYAAPCPNTELTGYGAHIMIHSGGVGMLEGIELYRVGQTNVLARYPIHFHMLDECPHCYVKDSSVHRSYYRCVTIHGTHSMAVSENVAYDVIGFCYYLEDGVETNNTLSFNLVAHVHMILPDEPPTSTNQVTKVYAQSDLLSLPADVSASGFYISNMDNHIIGNSASGGWSGFAVPILPEPVGLSQASNVIPSAARGLTFDGNTAHSTGWWWQSGGGAFYFGGILYFASDGVLTYNPGREQDPHHHRWVCTSDEAGDCAPTNHRWLRITNSKAYLTPSAALNSWSGRMEIVGYEAHDTGLGMSALASGFWMDDMLVVCRSGEVIAVPPDADVRRIRGSGFFWYDTDQEHVMTNATFQNCGYRSSKFARYNDNDDRGCGRNRLTGCDSGSTVFGFITHSDQFNPELMQGTSGISFKNCGRRFRLKGGPSSVSGRILNWIDVDGSATGLHEPSLIGSGLDECGLWWKVDDRVVEDQDGPLKFIRTKDGPERGLAHVRVEWDYMLHSKVGESVCGNGNSDPCPAVGYVRHLGPQFSNDPGLPITANSDIAGPVGGFGWLLSLKAGAPRRMTFSQVEVAPESPMLISIAYPVGTTFRIRASASPMCLVNNLRARGSFRCNENFRQVSSIQAVRESMGNTYHVSSEGVLTLRIIQTAADFVGRPEWFLPSWNDTDRSGRYFALDRFERQGVRLLRRSWGTQLVVEASCPEDKITDWARGFWNNLLGGLLDRVTPSSFCLVDRSPPTKVDRVCPDSWQQMSYDKCCDSSLADNCVYANGEVA